MPGPAERARALFRAAFGAAPSHAASAPGRVNLIGEHTDYNEGLVLPMAIEPRTAVAVGPGPGARWHFVSEQRPAPVSLGPDAVADPSPRDWTAYIRGVIAGFEAAGHAIGPMAVAVAGDVPVGGGLSSSAALEVAAATAFEGALGVRLAPWDKILLCQEAEHGFAGVPCGFMDQAAAVLAEPGRALLLDCGSLAVRPVPLDTDRVAVLVVNTMVRHELAGGEYARRRASCEEAAAALRARHPGVRSLRDATAAMLGSLPAPADSIVRRRARHVVTEIARVRDAAAALGAGDFARVGALMAESHASLRDDYEVSCPELDLLVELAAARPGVYGARMTGGGFGGCIVALTQAGGATQAVRSIVAAYKTATGLDPGWFVTRPAPGASPEL